MNLNKVSPSHVQTSRPLADTAGPSSVRGQSAQEIDPLHVQPNQGMDPPRLFAWDASGLPPARDPGEQSWDQALEELGQVVNLAASSTGDEQTLTLASAMRMLKALMLKNRESEMVLRDQQIVQGYDLKLQAIEQDKTTAKWQLASGIVKGGLDVISGGISIKGATAQMKQLKQLGAEGLGDDKVSLSAIDALGQHSRGQSQVVSGVSSVASSALDYGASLSRAEADKLRAQAEKTAQMQSQTNDRVQLAREILQEAIRAEKEVNDAMTQAVNKRLSV